MKLSAVIGAQFGDEGKGLVTDYLSDRDTLVVRHNGGAQAGHTVARDGARHVFGHFGSGTLRGATTLLSRFFIINPALFASELRLLESWFPRVLVDPTALVSTPYDVLLNRAVERKRSHERHGSCGAGINETVTRSLYLDGMYDLHVYDLRQDASLSILLRRIEKEWLPLRAEQLGVEVPNVEGVLGRFLRDVEVFRRHMRMEDDRSAIAGAKRVVFEGAQGLRLDEFAPGFPHVTRSRTGLTNVQTLVEESIGFEPLDVYYVTRAYVTRHGAGPLEGGIFEHPYGWKGNETNVYNAYQGALRYAKLNTDELAETTRRDLSSYRLPCRARLVITCLDQVLDGSVDAPAVSESVGLPLGLVSYGPTAEDVETAAREVVA